MKPFRQGIGLLATRSRVPFLPVALVGMETLRPGIRNWFRNKRLEVRIGKVIAPHEEWTPAQWTATLEAEMRRLLV